MRHGQLLGEVETGGIGVVKKRESYGWPLPGITDYALRIPYGLSFLSSFTRLTSLFINYDRSSLLSLSLYLKHSLSLYQFITFEHFSLWGRAFPFSFFLFPLSSRGAFFVPEPRAKKTHLTLGAVPGAKASQTADFRSE